MPQLDDQASFSSTCSAPGTCLLALLDGSQAERSASHHSRWLEVLKVGPGFGNAALPQGAAARGAMVHQQVKQTVIQSIAAEQAQLGLPASRLVRALSSMLCIASQLGTLSAGQRKTHRHLTHGLSQMVSVPWHKVHASMTISRLLEQGAGVSP